MKKGILSITFLLAVGLAVGQFNVEIGGVANIANGEFAKGYSNGLGGYVKPLYGVSENFDLGLFISVGGIGVQETVGLPNTVYYSVVPSAYYKVSKSSINPYIGFGLGFYHFKNDVFESNGVVVDGGEKTSKIGLSPSLGVNVRRFNFGTTFNVVDESNFWQIIVGFRLL